MSKSLSSAFEAHANGVADKADISILDIWIASHLNCDQARRNEIIEELTDIVSKTRMRKSERWTTLTYIVRKLDIKSASLLSEIDRKLSQDNDSCDQAYDLFSAWDCFIKLGGPFLPNMLLTRTTKLRNVASPLWFDLAIVAYAADHNGLLEQTVKLMNEGRLSSLDFQERYRDVAFEIGASEIVSFIIALIEKVNVSAEVRALRKWANSSLNLNLGSSNIEQSTRANIRIAASADPVLAKINSVPFSNGIFETTYLIVNNQNARRPIAARRRA
jgi:hypothetical protein